MTGTQNGTIEDVRHAAPVAKGGVRRPKDVQAFCKSRIEELKSLYYAGISTTAFARIQVFEEVLAFLGRGKGGRA